MTITYRKGTVEDTFSVYQIFTQALIDLGERTNVMAITGGNDPEVMKSLWESRKPLFDFLSRAFPKSDERYCTIIATLDERALYRYLNAGVYGRFPIKYFYRQAEKVERTTDLQIEPMQLEIHLGEINRIDQQIVGHQREAIHRWVITTRSGFVYKRNGKIVGYGYVGESSGPFVLLDDDDFPAVLAHAESLMAERGGEFGAETPLINKKAIQYFLERKYRIDAFTLLFMSNEPFGRFENYLCFSPIFFM